MEGHPDSGWFPSDENWELRIENWSDQDKSDQCSILNSQFSSDGSNCSLAAWSADVRVFEEVLHAVFVDEEIGFRASSDPDDVLVVVLDPTPNFFAVDQFDNDCSLVLGELVDVFAFAVCGFWCRLPSFTAAGELIN